ncbi:MAG: dienelactone hydrolase family protein [Alphaproteobacteria bacterium]|nr:dienelactone hydrolase family protein [Alphaproteobacteria bacterium]
MHRLLTALFFAALLSAAQAAPVAEQIEIPLSGGRMLTAQLFRPSGEGPFPAVIALHGCAGLGSRDDVLSARYRDWTSRIVKSGGAVLWPDNSREPGLQCSVRELRMMTRRHQEATVVAAWSWLAKQPWLKGNRISLIGWGNGASAVLWAVRPQIARRDSEPDFRAAVAFYPNCSYSAGLGWSTRVPTLVLIGARDEVTSPSACRQMVDGAHGRSALTRIMIYPGANHDFDDAGQAMARHDESERIPASRSFGGGNSEARVDAQKRVVEWLGR